MFTMLRLLEMYTIIYTIKYHFNQKVNTVLSLKQTSPAHIQSKAISIDALCTRDTSFDPQSKRVSKQMQDDSCDALN